MQFKEIIGQSGVKQQLVELVHHNRLSHALLFLGKEGNGSLQLAIALAQYLTCEKANPKKQSRLSSGPNSSTSLFGEDPPKSDPDGYRDKNQKSEMDSCGV